MSEDQILEIIEQTIVEQKMLEPGGRVVVALSGGRDSSALLELLVRLAPKWKLELAAAHFNHGLRGTESDRDQDFTRRLAGKHGLRFITEKAPAAPESNIEEWAREVRYKFLVEAAEQTGASRIAVGHLADDVAETILINLIRGAGTAGLAGMAPVREIETPAGVKYVIRPLIRLWRDDFPSRLARDYVEDSSNQDLRLARNKVRRQVIPLLETINPAVKKSLARTAEIMRSESAFINELAAGWIAGNAVEGTVPIDAVKAERAALRMEVYRVLIGESKGGLRRVSEKHLAAIDGMVTGGAPRWELDLPGVIARGEYGRLAFERPDAGNGAAGPKEAELAVPGKVGWTWPEGVGRVIGAQMKVPSGGFPDPWAGAWLDPVKVRPPIMVTSRQPGDRYSPLGMDGSRKLKDVMNELKVPPRLRDNYPVIRDRDRVLWVPGMRPADPVEPGADEVILITIDPAVKR